MKNKAFFLSLPNDLPQGSVLARLLFNIYCSDISATQSTKFMYADDIDMAIAIQSERLNTTEDTLMEDLHILDNNFMKWGHQPNPTESRMAIFHLNNLLTHHQLNMLSNGVRLLHDPCSKYVGVTLGRHLSYKTYLETLSAKVKPYPETY